MQNNKPSKNDLPPQSIIDQASFNQMQAGFNYEPIQKQIDDLNDKIDLLIRSHSHSGLGAQVINFNTDIMGLFETVSVAPTLKPSGPFDQVKIYVNGAVYRLYWYDATGQAWHYVTATA